MRTWILAAALIGCNGGSDLIGDDIGILNDGDSFTLEPAPVTDGDVDIELSDAEVTTGYQGAYLGGCMDPNESMMSVPMAAIGGVNRIEIVHQGVVEGIEPDWVIHGEIDESTRTIRMVYEVTSPDVSVETCTWELEYVIHGVPAGEWTVEARYDSATATVTE